jgi:hypothetical protein
MIHEHLLCVTVVLNSDTHRPDLISTSYKVFETVRYEGCGKLDNEQLHNSYSSEHRVVTSEGVGDVLQAWGDGKYGL